MDENQTSEKKETFLDMVRHNMDAETWCCESYKEIPGIALLSAIAQKKISMRYSKTTYYTNEYFLLVGPSKAGKSTAIMGGVYNILKEVIPESAKSGAYTPEGLLDEMKKDSKIIICHPEAQNFFPSGTKYVERLLGIITEFFDFQGNEFTKRLVSKLYKVKDPYLCLLLGIQSELLANIITENATASGGLQRYIIVPGLSVEKKKEPIDDSERADKIIRLLKLLNNAISGMKGEIRLILTKESIEMADKYIKQTDEQLGEDHIKSYYSRLLDHIYRLAMIYWLNENLTHVAAGRLSASGNAVSSSSLYSSISSSKHSNNKTSVSPVSPLNLKSVRTLRPVSLSSLKARRASEASDLSRIQAYSLTVPTPPIWDSLLLEDTEEITRPTIEILPRHIQKAIDFIDKWSAERNDILHSIIGTTDMKILQRFKDKIKNIVQRDPNSTATWGKPEIIDGEIYIRRKDILLGVGTTEVKAEPYIKLLIDEEILGPLEIKGKRKVYKYLGNDAPIITVRSDDVRSED